MIQTENTGNRVFHHHPNPSAAQGSAGWKLRTTRGVKIAWNPGRVRSLCRQDGWENITQLQERDLTSAGRLL